MSWTVKAVFNLILRNDELREETEGFISESSGKYGVVWLTMVIDARPVARSCVQESVYVEDLKLKEKTSKLRQSAAKTPD